MSEIRIDLNIKITSAAKALREMNNPRDWALFFNAFFVDLEENEIEMLGDELEQVTQDKIQELSAYCGILFKKPGLRKVVG